MLQKLVLTWNRAAYTQYLRDASICDDHFPHLFTCVTFFHNKHRKEVLSLCSFFPVGAEAREIISLGHGYIVSKSWERRFESLMIQLSPHFLLSEAITLIKYHIKKKKK